MAAVARFQDREQGEAFCGIAAEGGITTRLTDSRRPVPGFDGTLGGSNHVMGYAVHVKADDVPALRAHLESSMEIDPIDPLHTASSAELQAMVEGQLDGNLCEQITRFTR